MSNIYFSSLNFFEDSLSLSSKIVNHQTFVPVVATLVASILGSSVLCCLKRQKK